MPSTYILTSIPYNVSDIRLGSLIPNIRQPLNDASKFDATSVSDGSPVDLIDLEEKNLEVSLKTSDRSWFDIRLSHLISASFDKSQDHEVQISSLEGHLYELRSPRAIFKSLIARNDVREWIQEGILAGDKTYMVIGYRTFLDASTTRQAQSSRELAGQASLPLADATAAVGVPPGAAALAGLDVAAGAGRATSSDGNLQAKFPGERIYAVCYRRVTFNFFPKAGQAKLEGTNQWIMYPETMSGAAAEENAEIVDADLDDGDDERALAAKFVQVSEAAVGEVEAVFATLE